MLLGLQGVSQEWQLYSLLISFLFLTTFPIFVMPWAYKKTASDPQEIIHFESLTWKAEIAFIAAVGFLLVAFVVFVKLFPFS